MKTAPLLVHALTALTLAAAAASAHAQVVIGAWSFEITTPADLTNSTAYPSFNADVGSGTATGFHASSATDWSTPGGNGSANSFSANTWSVGDYFQFQVNTSGFQSIAVSWAQTSSSTGPGAFKLSYSLDGVAFVDFGVAYAVLVNGSPNTWSNTTPVAAATFARDLSSLSVLNNDTSIYFRLVDTSTTAAGGGTVAPTGTTRLDDFTVTGLAIPRGAVLTPVPEASTWSLGAIATLALSALARASRRRKP